MASLSQAKAPEVVVLDSVAASAADLSVSGGKVSITGMKPFYRSEVPDRAITLDYFLNETVAVENVYASTFTVGTEYSFYIEQDVNGVLKKTFISYTPTSTSGSAFATGLTAAVNAAINMGLVKASAATYTDGSTLYGVTITALTGYAVLRIVNASSLLTAASNYAVQTGTTTNPSISSNVLTVTKSSHGYVAGDVVCVKWVGGSGTINGLSASTGVVLRVKSATTNAFTADVVTSSSFSATYGQTTVQKLASARRGNGADLLADGFAVTSGNTYHIVTISGNDAHNGHTQYTKNPVPFTKILFVNAGDGDALDLMTRINQVKNWQDGSGNFDPALMA